MYIQMYIYISFQKFKSDQETLEIVQYITRWRHSQLCRSLTLSRIPVLGDGDGDEDGDGLILAGPMTGKNTTQKKTYLRPTSKIFFAEEL